MLSKDNLSYYFSLAFQEARLGIDGGHGGPFGAIVVWHDKIVGRGHNTVLSEEDPTAHAEINAVREAGHHLHKPHLADCVLITTAEPCPMCLASIYWADIKEVYYCLHKEEISKLGFRDDDIYHEFQLPFEKRSVKLNHYPDVSVDAKKLLEDWKKAGGQVY